MKNILLFAVLMLFSVYMQAQDRPLTSKNKKAVKEYNDGVNYLNGYNYEDALSSFERAILYDPKFIEPYIMIGTLYEEKKDYNKAVEYYEKSLVLDPDFFPSNFYNVGMLETKIGQYEKALPNFETFLKYSPKPGPKKQAEHGIEVCKFAINQIKNPKPFDPKPLGSGVNTENSEYMPALTADESTIIFTRLIKSASAETYSGMQEDFYTSKLVDGQWTQAIPLSEKLNSSGNEGAHTISPDGKTLYFTACGREAGKGSCDIYMSQWYKGGWDYPVNLYEMNSREWDSQPSISPDGKTIYFTSARNGGMDLFVTHLQNNGDWSEPVALPATINTTGSEMSPFLHPDGKTLYFTSDGHLGMGGLDIFYCRMNEDSTWSTPVNIGYPINTSYDEAFLFVSASGEKAYFATGGLMVQSMDIYSFDLYKEARPDPVTFLKGIVTEIGTEKPLQASFELADLKNGKVVASSTSDENGAFLLCIPTGKDYMLNVSAEKYLFYSDNFSLSGTHTKTDPFIKNINLQPIGSDAVVVLNNIFFDTDKYDLRQESFIELDKVKKMMLANPKMKIEIRGHTDNTGTKEHNLTLSGNRAKAVVTYLTSQGISKDRMIYKGYGDSMPRATNDTPEGRALNRRTEFKVISN